MGQSNETETVEASTSETEVVDAGATSGEKTGDAVDTATDDTNIVAPEDDVSPPEPHSIDTIKTEISEEDPEIVVTAAPTEETEVETTAGTEKPEETTTEDVMPVAADGSDDLTSKNFAVDLTEPKTAEQAPDTGGTSDVDKGDAEEIAAAAEETTEEPSAETAATESVEEIPEIVASTPDPQKTDIQEDTKDAVVETPPETSRQTTKQPKKKGFLARLLGR